MQDIPTDVPGDIPVGKGILRRQRCGTSQSSMAKAKSASGYLQEKRNNSMSLHRHSRSNYPRVFGRWREIQPNVRIFQIGRDTPEGHPGQRASRKTEQVDVPRTTAMTVFENSILCRHCCIVSCSHNIETPSTHIY